MEDGSRNKNQAEVGSGGKTPKKKTLKQQERTKQRPKGRKIYIKNKKYPERRKEPTPAAATTTTTTGQWTALQRACVNTRINRRQKYNSKCNTAKKTSG